MDQASKELTHRVERLKEEIEREVSDRLPRKVAVIAKNHFRQNFRDSGFRDGGLHPWQRTRRQNGKGTDAKYGPLTSSRNHLMNSTQATAQRGAVLVENPVEYAAIHNEGGNINTHPTVTRKMRKYAWHMVYSLAGKKKKGKLPAELPPEAEKWKALALTKKTHLNIRARMPRRQFIGNSAELREKVQNAISEAMEKIKGKVLGS